MRRARRSNAQINSVYRIYLAVKGEFNSVASLAHFLDISSSVITKWNSGKKPLPDASPKPKDFYNDRVRDGYVPEVREPLEIANNLPVKDEVYMLLVQGYSVEYISDKLSKSLESIVNTKAYFLRENIINPSQMNADLTIHEIGLVLGFSDSEVNDLYESGLKKIMDAIHDVNDLVSEPFEDEAFRNVGDIQTSKHYSLMM